MEAIKPRFFYGWIVVIAAGCVILTMYGTLLTFGIFFEPVLTEFGWTRAMTAGAFSVGVIIRGSLNFVTGRLTDKYGPRIVVTTCGLLLGAGYLLMSQISSIWQLYLFYGILVGLGMGGAWIPQLSTVARWFEKRRGLATGIAASGEGIGILILAPVATWLISAYGWRSSYIAVGTIALVLIVAAAQFLRRDPHQMGLLPYGEEAKKQSSNLQATGFSLRQAIHTRELWLLCSVYFCFLFCLNTILAHIVIHATGLGISATSAAYILAIIGGTSIIGRLGLGVLADRAGGKSAIIIGLIILTIALLWLQLASVVWMLYLFAAIFGLAFGGLLVSFPLITAERFGLTSHGTILGIITLNAIIGGSIGPVLVGRIFDTTGSYQLGFLICAAAGAIGFILALLSRPTHKIEA
ncbi:MAG: MFS transporter [Dehalococcoidia bacterium]|nr:MFS transporter [Dehalococcoidia bacterium]